MDEIRNKTIRFRVNNSEYESINERANGSVSDWLRSLALDQKPKKKAKPINKDLLYELNKIGVNLNQIARHSNNNFNALDKAILMGTLAEIQYQLTELRNKYDS